MDASLRSGAIGYLPQQTKAQKDFPATVSEVVLSGFLNSRSHRFFYSGAEKSQALMHMGKLGILELKDKCYRALSGGQQQRVLLCRALCATRRVLLLDEPVAGLDPVVTAELYGIIRDCNREGMTVIMISHDIEAAVRCASHILHVGNDIFFGTVDEYKESALSKRFLMQEGGNRLQRQRRDAIR